MKLRKGTDPIDSADLAQGDACLVWVRVGAFSKACRKSWKSNVSGIWAKDLISKPIMLWWWSERNVGRVC
jgi:hypothetical protein